MTSAPSVATFTPRRPVHTALPGDRLTECDARGRVVAREWTVNGRRHRMSLRWDDAGRLVEVCEFANGLKSGWRREGAIEFTYCMSAGGAEPPANQTRAMVTSMLPRVALE